jgi:hypothetical protein
MNRAEAVDQLKRVYTILNADLKAAQSATLRDPTEFNKRTLVRTCAALVEGLAYQLRQVTLASLKNTQLLTLGDRATLTEVKYQLSAQGTVQERDNFQSTLPQLLFSLRIYAKNHGADFDPNTSDNGWNCLRKAFALRDRLMHPKSLADLEVTDGDGEEFAAGVQWWDSQILQLFAACEAADKAILAKETGK